MAFPPFSWGFRCSSEGCDNPRSITEEVCGACAIRIANAMKREEARWALYAREGIRLLERHLANWAAFDAWENRP